MHCIARAPYRISFFGGATDYACWFNLHGGSVFAAAINKYAIAYSSNSGDAVRVEHSLPMGCGLGSSSAETVAKVHAASPSLLPSVLAKEAIRIEQDVLHHVVGCQDQMMAAYGGVRLLVFPSMTTRHVNPIYLPDLEKRLMLFRFRSQRPRSGDTVKTYSWDEAYLKRIHALVELGVHAVESGDLRHFGRLLHDGWVLKKELSRSVSTAEVDDAYRAARDAGALGGKLTGAGAGGCLLLYVEPEKQDAVAKVLAKLHHIPFRFELRGSTVVHRSEHA